MKIRVTSLASAVLAASLFSTTTFASDAAISSERLAELLQRIEALENQLKAQQHTPATATVTAEAQPPSRPARHILSAENGVIQVAPSTTVKFGGYLQADLMYDLRFKNGEHFNASNTPDSAVDDQSHTFLQARQSRMSMATSTDVGTDTPLQTYLEVDFMGSQGNEVMGNSHNLRLRNGYVRYGRFMAGQDWSNFQDYVGLPTLLDVSSPAGRVFVRQAQVRMNLGQFALALENPETQPVLGATNHGESLGGIGRDRLPDLTAAWRGGPGGAAGSYHVAAVLRELSVDGTVNGVDYDDSKTGWGFNVAGMWALNPNTSLKANAVYGDGIGRYINNGWANDMRLNADGSVETITSWGASVALEQRWTPTTASTFSIGHFNNEDDFAAFGTEKVNTYRMNYRWYPLHSIMIGGELMHATRDFVDGRDGDNTRLQLSVRKSF
ncbi:DcaP family trimeric outer membrane transporter [Halopseudomonas xiamenensis]|uniref:DcaP family trimeric outer membrane transporter n=1 Tax=Halopseudomonas xiamenensis TaxID=157792 RepID=UPI001627EEA9|nr:DcaP family trimeric outer membrane transporter [Halopseudomonas xiamenensis]